MYKECFYKRVFLTVSNENNTYVGLTATTLSRWFTMHLNDSSSLKKHSLYMQATPDDGL